jgi:hypothetical protein
MIYPQNFPIFVDKPEESGDFRLGESVDLVLAR